MKAIPSQLVKGIRHLTGISKNSDSKIGPGYTETTVAFTSDDDGRVFISVMSTDSYRVECFHPGGEQFLVIERSFEKVLKTPLEIEEEIEDFNNFLA